LFCVSTKLEQHFSTGKVNIGILDEAQICLDFSAFYGIVSYAVGVSLILSLAGIKVGRRFFRRRSGRASTQKVNPLHYIFDPLCGSNLLRESGFEYGSRVYDKKRKHTEKTFFLPFSYKRNLQLSKENI
jgi:hypothetical protein